MRKIQFRGRMVSNGGWVYGYYWRDNSNGKHKITIDLSDDNFMCHEVIPQTVGQLVRQNIYEHDIVKVTDGADGLPHEMKGGIYKVTYSEVDAQFMLEQLDEKDAISFDEVCSYEVIGNTHEDFVVTSTH